MLTAHWIVALVVILAVADVAVLDHVAAAVLSASESALERLQDQGRRLGRPGPAPSPSSAPPWQPWRAQSQPSATEEKAR